MIVSESLQYDDDALSFGVREFSSTQRLRDDCESDFEEGRSSGRDVNGEAWRAAKAYIRGNGSITRRSERRQTTAIHSSRHNNCWSPLNQAPWQSHQVWNTSFIDKWIHCLSSKLRSFPQTHPSSSLILDTSLSQPNKNACRARIRRMKEWNEKVIYIKFNHLLHQQQYWVYF